MEDSELSGYIVKYSPDKYPRTTDGPPITLMQALITLYKEADFYSHSSKRNFVAVKMPKSKVDDIRKLDGIEKVYEDVSFETCYHGEF